MTLSQLFELSGGLVASGAALVVALLAVRPARIRLDLPQKPAQSKASPKLAA